MNNHKETSLMVSNYQNENSLDGCMGCFTQTVGLLFVGILIMIVVIMLNVLFDACSRNSSNRTIENRSVPTWVQCDKCNGKGFYKYKSFEELNLTSPDIKCDKCGGDGVVTYKN